MTDKHKKSIAMNIIYAFIAQGISLLLSILTSLIVPKMLGIEEYGYWQLFLFYSSYVGFFHLGLNDGIYLKYGGTNYDDLDKSLIGKQLRFGIIFQTTVAIIVVFFAMVFIQDSNRSFILITTAIYMLLFNISLFLGYVFQTTNETKWYSLSVMIDKAIYIVSIIILLIFKVQNFKTYILLYLAAKFVALLYCIWLGKSIVFCKKFQWNSMIKESLDSIKIGINLMIAGIASMLISGIGRFAIDRVWGIEEFGKLSFSLSLSVFFLLFISQVSMVLFPTLRQTSEEKLKPIYLVMRDGLAILLPLIFLIYIPVKCGLLLWLPQYGISLKYLAILLPICTFDGKMSMLCNTYFKVLREERFLLKVNLKSMALSAALSCFGAFILKDIYCVLVFMVASIAFRSIISEIYLAKLMEVTIYSTLIKEIILVVIFMYCSWFLPDLYSFIIVVISYTVYLMLNKKKCLQFWNIIKIVKRASV